MDAFDRDMTIRTVLGEAGNQSPLGQAAVAHVIMNRVRLGKWGDSPADVVTAKNQFEPWQTRKGELLAIRPTDPRYIRAARIVDAVASGGPDPTDGATHFANVATVRDRNGGTVGHHSWIDPKNATAVIGAHSFFAPDGPVKPGPTPAWNMPPTSDSAPVASAEPASSDAKGPDMDTTDAPPQSPFAALLAKMNTHAQGGNGGFNPQDPMRGALSRGLYNLFSGDGFHIGATKPMTMQTSPTTQVTANQPGEQAIPGVAPNTTPTDMPDAPVPTARPSTADLQQANPGTTGIDPASNGQASLMSMFNVPASAPPASANGAGVGSYADMAASPGFEAGGGLSGLFGGAAGAGAGAAAGGEAAAGLAGSAGPLASLLALI
jgi:hypothetical protein